MSTYAPLRQPSAGPTTTPTVPCRPAQLRTPVPPARQVTPPPRRHRPGIGRPSHWALAVGSLLVGLLLGLVWSSTAAASAATEQSGTLLAALNAAALHLETLATALIR